MGLADEVADGPGGAARGEGAAAEDRRGVDRAATAQLVVDAGERDVVALADRAVVGDEPLRHDEERDAPRSGRRVGQLGQDEVDDVVAHLVVAAGDPHLAAEDPVGAVVGRDGAGEDVAEARPGVRLGERHRAEEAALQHRLDIALDLLGGAVGEQQSGVGDSEEGVRRGADVGGGEPRHAGRRPRRAAAGGRRPPRRGSAPIRSAWANFASAASISGISCTFWPSKTGSSVSLLR